MVYVISASGVPLNVTTVVLPEQIEFALEIVAVGDGKIVRITGILLLEQLVVKS